MHGLAPGTIEKMILELAGVCPICARAGELVVDHARKCCDYMPTVGRPTCGKCIRGMVCRTCNAGMGQLGDNPEWLLAAAAHLLKNVDLLSKTEA
jgi:hypothetical protein